MDAGKGKDLQVTNDRSKIVDFVSEVEVFDLMANKVEVEEEYDLELVDTLSDDYDVVIFAVPHKELLVFLSESTTLFCMILNQCSPKIR